MALAGCRLAHRGSNSNNSTSAEAAVGERAVAEEWPSTASAPMEAAVAGSNNSMGNNNSTAVEEAAVGPGEVREDSNNNNSSRFAAELAGPAAGAGRSRRPKGSIWGSLDKFLTC